MKTIYTILIVIITTFFYSCDGLDLSNLDFGNYSENGYTYSPILPLTPAPINFNPDLKYGTMTDQNNNIYKTINIGTQTWMAENLRTTKYRNLDLIANIIDTTKWRKSIAGAYCWYGSYEADSMYKSTHGPLYNWYAVNDSRNIAPAGWHVATKADWTILVTYLGGDSIAGGKMKETGCIHWHYPNNGATNSSGFTALASGARIAYNDFVGSDWNAVFWSATEDTPSDAFGIGLDNSGSYVFQWVYLINFGCSVRCVKD